MHQWSNFGAQWKLVKLQGLASEKRSKGPALRQLTPTSAFLSRYKSSQSRKTDGNSKGQ